MKGRVDAANPRGEAKYTWLIGARPSGASGVAVWPSVPAGAAASPALPRHSALRRERPSMCRGTDVVPCLRVIGSPPLWLQAIAIVAVDGPILHQRSACRDRPLTRDLA